MMPACNRTLKRPYFPSIFILVASGSVFFTNVFFMYVEAINFNKPITSFCVGVDHGCAAFTGKGLKCWGWKFAWGAPYVSSFDYLGDDVNELGTNMPFVNVGNNGNILQLECGLYHVCMKFDTSSMKCIGSNDEGQAGIESTNDKVSGSANPSIINLGSGVQVQSIAVGSRHVCALTTVSKVKCFGGNGFGQLGLGDSTNRGRATSSTGDNLAFVNLGTDVLVASIHSSPPSNFNCAVLSAPSGSEQRIKCWGLNSSSQLGYGTTLSGNRGDAASEMGDDLPLVDLGAESKVKQLALGAGHVCALLINDVLKCWGLGLYGQLGSGDTNDITLTGDSLPFVTIDSGYIIKKIIAGRTNTCILYDDNITLKCFGQNNYGQLGQGDATNRGDHPTRMIPSIPAIQLGAGAENISSIYNGGDNSCVVFTDDSVKCFGQNEMAQLAIGSTSPIGDGPGEMGNNLLTSTFFSYTEAPSFPTNSPTNEPTKNPTLLPSASPTKEPTVPTNHPTLAPTNSPVNPTPLPTTQTPTKKPTSANSTPTTSSSPTSSDASTLAIGLGVAIPSAVVLSAVLFFIYRRRSSTTQIGNGSIVTHADPTASFRRDKSTYQKKYIGFLSHCKADTGPTASMIYEDSPKYLSARGEPDSQFFIDNEYLTDLRGLPDRVGESKVMVVMLSKAYLTRPWCLIELYFALEFDIPIVTVNVVGAGYNFEQSKKFLETLTEKSLNKVNSGASTELNKLNIDIKALGQRLSQVLPKIIAHQYDPNSPKAIREAQLGVIIDSIIEISKKQQA